MATNQKLVDILANIKPVPQVPIAKKPSARELYFKTTFWGDSILNDLAHTLTKEWCDKVITSIANQDAVWKQSIECVINSLNSSTKRESKRFLFANFDEEKARECLPHIEMPYWVLDKCLAYNRYTKITNEKSIFCGCSVMIGSHGGTKGIEFTVGLQVPYDEPKS